MKTKIPVTVYETINIYDLPSRFSELSVSNREVVIKWVGESPYLVYTI